MADLKIDCDCRKPKPGMIVRAAEKYHINLEESFMVGDGENDVKAGISAGCKTVLIQDDLDGSGRYGQTDTVRSLLEFVKKWL